MRISNSFLPFLLLLCDLIRHNLRDACQDGSTDRASWSVIDCACEYEAGAVHAEVCVTTWNHLGSDRVDEADHALSNLLDLLGFRHLIVDAVVRLDDCRCYQHLFLGLPQRCQQLH